MDMVLHPHSSSSSSSASSSSETTNNKAGSWSSSSSPQQQQPAAAKKRPAGRTKFRETRHPVFRGVRRRGPADRWVCEVRVPGRRGCRLWLGTYVTAEAAARAHDAAMLALGGAMTTASLNFPDSAWLLAVPRVPAAAADLADVRRAAVEAVAEFQRRHEAASGAAGAVDEVTSNVSSVPDISASTFQATAPAECLVVLPAKAEDPAALDGDMFEPDWFGDMHLDMYYANLAQGLLMEPPPPSPGAWELGECGGDGAADVALWSY